MAGSEWRKGTGGLKKDRTETVECSNRFSLLMGESERGMDEVIVVKDRKDKEGEGKGRKGVSGPPQVLVVGDSQVRYLDSAFCGRDKRRRSRSSRGHVEVTT